VGKPWTWRVTALPSRRAGAVAAGAESLTIKHRVSLECLGRPWHPLTKNKRCQARQARHSGCEKRSTAACPAAAYQSVGGRVAQC
jgi:hypothetical protein